MSDDLRDYDNVSHDLVGPYCSDCKERLYTDSVGRVIPHRHEKRRS